MFTGIVEEVGHVVSAEPRGDSVRLAVRGTVVVSDLRPGHSVAVNGCCLTVTEHDVHTFCVDVVQESLERTTLGALRPGSPVNLERAVAVGGRLGGHIVQGHVDATGTVLQRCAGELSETVRIGVPDHLSRYLVPKGSVTVDGVSLTVVDVATHGETSFSVALIPTTLSATTLGDIAPDSLVNLEVDVLAKYVERLLVTSGTAQKERP